jgi:Ca2+-binding RTX toxin-like protein
MGPGVAAFGKTIIMVLRYKELVAFSGNDLLNASQYAAMMGLQGDDDFYGVSSLAIGGSGNDYYHIGSPAIMTILDRSGTNDVVQATGIGFGRDTTHAIALDYRHLVLLDTASSQAVILLDWQVPACRIEQFILSGVTYSYAQFEAEIAAFPRFEGHFTWEGAAAAGYFPAGATDAEINEALAYYRAKSIMLEQPAFAVANTDTATNGAIAAIPYTGPVGQVDLEFIGSDAGEAIVGTAFSDFINGGGGTDAIDGGLGDDVLDGGLGSNFLTGGAGRDIFFLDGRGGGATWSTITDWDVGEQLSLWGWLPGVSTAAWVASDGTPGWTGVTLHADLDGDGTIETSVTWTGRTQGDLPVAKEFEGLLWFV